MWDCSAQLEKEKQIQDKSAFACWMPCVPTGLMAEGLVAGGWGGGTARGAGHWGFACSTKGESRHKICLNCSSRQRRDAWCSAKFAVVST